MLMPSKRVSTIWWCIIFVISVIYYSLVGWMLFFFPYAKHQRYARHTMCVYFVICWYFVLFYFQLGHAHVDAMPYGSPMHTYLLALYQCVTYEVLLMIEWIW